MKLLYLHSSILRAHLASRQATAWVLERLTGAGNVDLVERDLVADPLPRLKLPTLPSGIPRRPTSENQPSRRSPRSGFAVTKCSLGT